MTDDHPTPPEPLPAYLSDGLPKQDLETLTATRDYLDELIAVLTEPVEADELPDSADPVEDADSGGRGTIVTEKVSCGDDSCHCADGELHGPYKYRYFRDADGTLTSEYVGKPGDSS